MGTINVIRLTTVFTKTYFGIIPVFIIKIGMDKFMVKCADLKSFAKSPHIFNLNVTQDIMMIMIFKYGRSQ